MNRKLIVLELNEVPDRVIEAFVEQNPYSNWAALTNRSARFIAATPDTIQLHPKLSWQTFHRGVPDVKHGYKEYNQIDAPGKGVYPPVWELLQKAGKTIGIGASIGSTPPPESKQNLKFYIADPFAPTNETTPDYLSYFQKINTMAVQHSGRNVRSGGFSKSDALHLLINLPRLGITPTTCFKTVKQLVSERLNPTRIIRRRNVQALMTFDVVFQQIKNTKPDFCTVFANHVAASMHRYWAARFPDDYESNNMPQEWRDTYAGEIDTAMQEADYMLGKLFRFARSNPEYSIMVVASMGQAAIEHEVVKNQLIIKDFDAFMSMLGMKNYKKLTGMEPEYVVEFSDSAGLEAFKEACERLKILGKSPYLKPMNDTQTAFLVEHTNIELDSVSMGNREVPLAETGLSVEPIQDMSGSTAQHIPGGCCFVFNGFSSLAGHGEPNKENNSIAVTSAIMTALGVTPPDYMEPPVPGIVKAISEQPDRTEGNPVGGLANA
ncbi:MAG: hypothetical protein KTR35_14850 [Gammaproteobacteria bacterium]|nr:hypothetical protein [Gammaproteobacteria bacterium]